MKQISIYGKQGCKDRTYLGVVRRIDIDLNKLVGFKVISTLPSPDTDDSPAILVYILLAGIVSDEILVGAFDSEEAAYKWEEELMRLAPLENLTHVYLVRFVSGNMPETCIVRDEGIFSSEERAEKWVREECEIWTPSGEDKLYIEKHPVDYLPPFDKSVVIKEFLVSQIAEWRQS